jgi:hypothetical protein
MRRIVLLELNEVPFKIVDQFCQANPQSTLARTLPQCRQYDTYAEDRGSLSPWITWPTVHRGVTNERHHIHSFGQDLGDVNAEYPPIWEILSGAGISTGICGTLHTYPIVKDLSNYSFYLPDTFAAGSECFPNSLSVFQEFNLTMARESARNVSTRVPWKSALRVLASAPELGFKLETFADVGAHLWSERAAKWRKVRRRTYQAVLAFDIFMKQLEQTQPAFSSFFTNHVASAMHRFWAAAFPDDYENFGYDDAWVKTYRNEIDFTMWKVDRFVSRLVAFVDRHPGYALWVATSMGQAATEALPLETQLYITNPATFMSALGLEEGEWKVRPAMLPDFNFWIAPTKRDAFQQRLDTLRVVGKRVNYKADGDGFFNVCLGHPNLYKQPPVAHLGDRAIDFKDIGLDNVEIEDRSGSSAYHIPQGCLVIYDPQRPSAAARSQISTIEIAPALLNNFSVPVPSYMKPGSLAL